MVYYLFAGADRSGVQQLSGAIQQKGYRIPEERSEKDAKGLNEVRYFYASDQKAATKLATDVTAVLRDRGFRSPPTRVVDRTNEPTAGDIPGVLELWLDASSLRR